MSKRIGGTPVLYLGWLRGASAKDIRRMKSFGFTGEMIICSGHVGYVHATPEIMERAIREWPDFNATSFTGVDENGDRSVEQLYWNRQ